MDLGLLLHLYQPYFQKEETFNSIYESCYYPLLDLIKKNKNFNLTLNIPAVTLYLFEKFGHRDWLLDLKELYISERVELTGSAAFHPLLTSCNDTSLYMQVALNEYGLTQYFGEARSIDGQESNMIKNVIGFFPPELAVNSTVSKHICDLGYKWMVVDETTFHTNYRNKAVRNGDRNFDILVRDKNASDYIAFNRTSNLNELLRRKGSVIAAIDAETFGHHNKLGIAALSTLLKDSRHHSIKFYTLGSLRGKLMSVSEEELLETTWAASALYKNEHSTEGAPMAYVHWKISDNKHHEILWDVLKLNNILISSLHENMSNMDEKHEYNSFFEMLDALNVQQNSATALFAQLMRLQGSDVLWWTSESIVADGIILRDLDVLRQHIDNYLFVGNVTLDEKQTEIMRAIQEKIQELSHILK